MRFGVAITVRGTAFWSPDPLPGRRTGQVVMANGMGLDDQGLTALYAVGPTVRFGPGQTLFSEGDRSDHVLIIRRGRVKISSVSSDGYEAVLAVRSAGDVVGEFAALDGGDRSASVSTMDAVEAVLIDGERFRGFLRTHPDLALILFGEVVGRLREADRQRLEFGAHDVVRRVSRLLLELADRFGSVTATGTTIAVPLSQHELAGATGASREAVARALRRLRESGAVVTGRRRIVVIRSDLLREFSAGYETASRG
jgi:CRP/FNR family transcriptional regulator, cyclic AMP receptor protein